jgi:hypothetical protein
METEMVLTLEELDEIKRQVETGEWWCRSCQLRKPFLLKLIAAARAHLEQQAIDEVLNVPQPQQQREDDGTLTNDIKQPSDKHCGDYPNHPHADALAPAPSPTVEPHKAEWEAFHRINVNAVKTSPGLVERVYDLVATEKDMALCNEIAAALEAKDAEARYWKGLMSTDEDSCHTQLHIAWTALEAKDAEIERLRKAYPFHAWAKQKAEAQAEIERLRKLLKGCWDSDTLPRTLEMDIEDVLGKATEAP